MASWTHNSVLPSLALGRCPGPGLRPLGLVPPGGAPSSKPEPRTPRMLALNTRAILRPTPNPEAPIIPSSDTDPGGVAARLRGFGDALEVAVRGARAAGGAERDARDVRRRW